MEIISVVRPESLRPDFQEMLNHFLHDRIFSARRENCGILSGTLRNGPTPMPTCQPGKVDAKADVAP